MTERAFLALPVEEQNDILASRCMGWRIEDDRYWRNPQGQLVSTEGPRFVNGDGNAFFEVWDALPRDIGGNVAYWTISEGPCGYFVECDLLGTPTGSHANRTLAVALALLKARGVID